MSRDENKKLWEKIILIIGMFLLWSLIKGFRQIREGYKRVDEAKQILSEEKEKNDELKMKLGEVQQGGFTEKMIREDLNMQKQGELIVILPEDQAGGGKDEMEPEEQEEMVNWEKWWMLIR